MPVQCHFPEAPSGDDGAVTKSLRIRTSIVLLLGTLLIPVVTSSLRGLTHTLSCSSALAARFDVEVPEAGEEPETVLLDPTAITRPPDGGEAVQTTAPPETTTTTTAPEGPAPVCGGITVDLSLSAPRPGVVRIELPVTNSGPHEWLGTVRLTVGTKQFPVDLGSIPPGQTRSRTLEVAVAEEIDRVTGELLLGP